VVSAAAIVREVAEAVRLAEGEAGVHDVLRAMRRDGPVSTRALSRATGLPVPIVAAVSGELRKRGIVARERPTRLTDEGRRLFGTAHHAGAPLGPALAELTALAELAPRARGELDQSHCTVETKVRRAMLLRDEGALEGKRVLLLGDDDLLSLALHRLGLLETVAELVVVDVDPAVLAFVARGLRLRQTKLPVACVEHDLRHPLPPTFAARFDTVFTDPPYTVEGAELFLSRAATALAPRVGGSVFLAFGAKPPVESLRVQSAIAAMGFVIREIRRNFNDYLHASILGGTSHLYHLTTTGQTKPLADGVHRGDLYTGDKRPARRYRCASCRRVQQVGRGARWLTVDLLKSDGCPECGATRFLPLPRGT
jgi:N4-bis(aminopropyl)spermidine synthase